MRSAASWLFPARLAVLLAAGTALAPLAVGLPAAHAQPRRPAAGAPQAQGPSQGGQSETIVAVVNGSPVTSIDVDARTKLFALSTGLPLNPDVLARLRPQVTRQLVEERLRLQEIEKRKVVVPDQEVADAVHEIEQRNNMPPGTLRARLEGTGSSMGTLVNELRVQIGWTRVLRETLGDRAKIGDGEIAQRQALMKAQAGEPEYDVGEIFIPVDNPAQTADAQRFADTVIQQLRAGAPFAVVAAQFSQDQTALEGGSLGWIRPNQLDPEVARIVTQMPAGAISDPIPVPGGFSIVALRARRQAGSDMATFLNVHQIFLAFAQPLNPQAPTEQQHQILEKAKQLSLSVKSCDDLDAANKANNSARPPELGQLRLDEVNPPQLRALLATLPVGKSTPPLIAGDGVAIVMVCSRDEKNAAELSPQQVAGQLLHERVEMQSRALDRELKRGAIIQMRNTAT